MTCILPIHVAFPGHTDVAGLFYCTRKYYGDELEGQQSYFDYLQVNYPQPHVITRYKVCSGRKTYSVVPRSWVVEVSGIPPSHTLNKVRENATARNVVNNQDLPWVPISTVTRAETSGLASLVEGDQETCVLFQTTMADVMAATIKRKTRRLVHVDTSIVTPNNHYTNHTNQTSVAVAVDVRWTRDLQCRKGHTGPLCANCYNGFARSLVKSEGCIDCGVDSTSGRRLRNQFIEYTYPMYRSLVKSTPVTQYIAYRRRRVLAVCDEKNESYNGTSHHNNHTNQSGNKCIFDPGQVLIGERTTWQILGPTVALAMVIFVFAFVFAIIGMAMPANMEEDDGVDMAGARKPKINSKSQTNSLKNNSSGSQLKNHLKIIVTFTQIFSSMDQIYTVDWPPVFVTFMKSCHFINLDFASLIGGAIDPCAFNTPFLYGFAVHVLMFPGFLVVLFVAFLMRGYAAALFNAIGHCRICQSKYCKRCEKFFNSHAGRHTTILNSAKNDVASRKLAITNTTKTYTNTIERIEKLVTSDKAKLKKIKNEAKEKASKEDGHTKEEDKEMQPEDEEQQKQLAVLVEKIKKSKLELKEARARQKKDLKELTVQCKEAEASLKDAMKLLDDVKKESNLAKDRLVNWTNMAIFILFPGTVIHVCTGSICCFMLMFTLFCQFS